MITLWHIPAPVTHLDVRIKDKPLLTLLEVSPASHTVTEVGLTVTLREEAIRGAAVVDSGGRGGEGGSWHQGDA